jgi:SH3-like domain-containing protein
VRTVLFILLFAVVTAVGAETVYVSERQFVNLRGDFVDAAVVVKRLESGAALEVLERTDLLWRVRDSQGAEGWIEPRVVSTVVPARLRVAALEKETSQLKAALAAERDKLKSLEASLATQKERLADTKEKLVAAASLPPPMPEPAVTGEAKGFAFSLAWLVISFAMLGLGIVVGVIWIREGIRRRMGGMYLRV